MLRELDPVVRRQAHRICRDCPSIIEDAYQEARIRLWTLLEEGITERPYLLAATKHQILNFLRHEKYEPTPFVRDDCDRDPWLFIPAEDSSIGDATARCVIEEQEGNLQSALRKMCFSEEPMVGAERVALHRYRKQQDEREWLQ